MIKMDIDSLEEFKKELNSKIKKTTEYNETSKKINLKDKYDERSRFLDVLSVTTDIWQAKQNQQINLRRYWGYSILAVLILQIGLLLFIIYNAFFNSKEVGLYFNIYISGVFVQVLVIPKIISEHLFPKEEINHTTDIMKLLLNSKNKNE